MIVRKIVTMTALLSMAAGTSACADPSMTSVHGDSRRATPRAEPRAPESALPSARGTGIAGCWDLAVTEPHSLEGRFDFVVEGDSLGGTVTLHGDEHEVRRGTVDGHRFGFRIDMSGTPIEFEGEHKGSALAGTLTRSGQALAWSARRCKG